MMRRLEHRRVIQRFRRSAIRLSQIIVAGLVVYFAWRISSGQMSEATSGLNAVVTGISSPADWLTLLIAFFSAISTTIGVNAAFRAANLNRACLVPVKIRVEPRELEVIGEKLIILDGLFDIENAGNSPATNVCVYFDLASIEIKPSLFKLKFLPPRLKLNYHHRISPEYVAAIQSNKSCAVTFSISQLSQIFGKERGSTAVVGVAVSYRDPAGGGKRFSFSQFWIDDAALVKARKTLKPKVFEPYLEERREHMTKALRAGRSDAIESTDQVGKSDRMSESLEGQVF